MMTRCATFRRRAAAAMLGLGVASLGLAEPAAASGYGCRGLAEGQFMASVEGREGVFFRLHPDLHNHHPMAPETIADLATLTQALAANSQSRNRW